MFLLISFIEGGSVQPANFVVIDVEKLESVPSETTNSSKTMSTFLPPEPESISRSASSYSLVNDDSKEGDDELTASNNTSSNNLTVSNNNTSETNRSSSRIDLLAKSTADGQGDVAGKVREEGVVAVVDDDDDDGVIVVDV